MIDHKIGTSPGAADPARAKSRVRDRIFETACNLFYRHGIHGVGVDAIAAEAGSNKMSFYRSFASKEALVTEYLREREREYWVWWDDAVARHPGNPRRQIEALFEAQLEFANSKTCRGCALGNAAVEITDDEDALSTLVRQYKEKVRHRLHALARAMQARDAENLGDALMLLMDGGYFTRLIFPAQQRTHCRRTAGGAHPHRCTPARERPVIPAAGGSAPLTVFNNPTIRV